MVTEKTSIGSIIKESFCKGFKGRASRLEYLLIHGVFALIVGTINRIIDCIGLPIMLNNAVDSIESFANTVEVAAEMENIADPILYATGSVCGKVVAAGMPFALIEGIFALVMLWVIWTAAVRRLHDVGHSGWFLCLGLIPLIGPFVVTYTLLSPAKEPAEDVTDKA